MIKARKIRDVLTCPDRFFSELSEREVNLAIPAGIVLISALIDAILIVMIIGTILCRFPGDLAQSGTDTAFLSIGELISWFAFWLIVAAVFYAISVLFNGNGSFKRCLEFTGYGFIPAIVASVIGLVVIMVVLLTIEFPVESPELMTQTLMPQLEQNPLMKTLPIITNLLGLWGAYIWIFGVKHARNISTRDALITVGVPAGIAIMVHLNYAYNII
ncbi:MAG: YIP1 family protein, partial [Euryarchaeota archaeon]|nr:YIP1 family protein [Euryarchaeota archaeon]